MPPPVTNEAAPQFTVRRKRSLEPRQTAIDQVVPDMRLTIVAAASSGAGLCQFEGLVGDLPLAESADSRQFLDHVAIAIARREIHTAVDIGRVLAQRMLDHAHRLDELAPIRG